MRSLTVLSLWSASLGLLAKSNENRVGGVDLHGLLGAHVSGLGGITKCLGLHNTFHVGGPAVLTSHETSWRVSKTVGNNDLLNLIVEGFLYELAQIFSLGLGCLKGSLLLLTLGDCNGSRRGGGVTGRRPVSCNIDPQGSIWSPHQYTNFCPACCRKTIHRSTLHSRCGCGLLLE
jgi:hypothetical protein